MILNASLLFSVVALFGLSTYVGLIPVHRMIRRREAQHELRAGSASYLRRMGGVVFVMIWVVTVLCLSTILGDWAVTGDLNAALERAGMRTAVMLEIAASNTGMR
ncbi:hypothetical protein [uncultured Sulfitobacter sp.]|uniref:hypothetical protein n=1 Tax=uncultured Sulfitobacter sp. TaxID=191468 RepID=UPI00262291B3|nr:hypothetical protein [uncultured Sulfitobacter sp.]